MAVIKAAANEKVFQITAFHGLNQNPDGDTKLKLGEAAVMNNFRITRDRNLQRRPGTKTLVDLKTSNAIKGLWTGYVNGHEYMLGACNGKLYKFWDDITQKFKAAELGAISTDKDVHIFGFSNIVYILDGSKYRQWDGTTLKEVEGYRPLVKIAIPPVGTTAGDKSASLENVNRLNAKRRVNLSPDGVGTVFMLPEKDILAVDYIDLYGYHALGWEIVVDTFGRETYRPLEEITVETSDGDYDIDIDFRKGTITFSEPPPAGVESIEVGYSAKTSFRSQVENMQYAELFSGTQDTRIFLYGDGTNKTIYSGMDYYGNPRADYFPDLYEALVGDENTPITSMIRHYSSLACFKANSAWSISASTLTLSEGLNIPDFYVTPINKEIGCAAMGQARLVLNSPFTLFGNDLYEWKNSSYYTSNLTRDERQAKRISDRVWAAIKKYKLDECYCYDDNNAQEYYICYSGNALVYNYAADAWSKYSDFPVNCMTSMNGELYIGSPDGKLKHFSYQYSKDDEESISAYWESGSMGFGQDYMRKYSAMLWVGIKPESYSEVTVTAVTDAKDTLNEKVVSFDHFSFSKINFAKWNFNVNSRPTMKRLKIKAKKFVFYKLVFKCVSRATIVAADIRVRYTGMTK